MARDGDFRFGTFDPAAELYQTSRDLPHWFQPGAAIFITFRTADSMPKAVIAALDRELKTWLARNDFNCESAPAGMEQIPAHLRSKFSKFKNRQWHHCLDECHGACLLRDQKLAGIVAETLRYFDGDRYHLDRFVVMPNHVHALVQFHDTRFKLAKISDSWLRYSATQINRALGRSGSFWQREPFDHIVRTADQFDYLRTYIQRNPGKARLASGEYYYWSAA